MNVLITGASGFIGGAFLRRFAALEGVSLCGVGRREHVDFPSSVRYCALALDRLDELDFTPDVVIHAAGRASPWGTKRDYYRDNVETTRQVIDFCRRRGFPRLIFISSAAVYYRFEHRLGLRESDPIGPVFTGEYGRSKRRAELLVEDYCGEKTIFRPCAAFGDGDRLLFPPLLAAAKKGKLVKLLAEGVKAQADIMHVDALCDYLMRAATYPKLRACYNISADRPVETEGLLCEALQQLGLPQPEKTVRLRSALRFAGALELLWRWLPLSGEPPITRFGVAVFGYASTLDVTPMLDDFGPPSVDFTLSLRAFLQQYREAR
ncbi:dehydrogenase [Leminorella grimontii]|uniref:Dehydrogenase n=1 Tax=Leminorella grimontii TaxID=82981 RepID=A0AAV5N3T2_9GAMM|nr:NAD(P)-dependent oxidoreductase [Leminorella grimontii]KFC97932.1 NAD(P)H steroid dehydrogenase-like protein in alkane synthesis cluster [Leminorella grimontii ATCC 33999 = DSM 5078]GKX55411.1 dehydrogenase [Leminorella grimontii]VFS56292.1 Cholesterol dehydrogenase [Leminorella grimontii]